LHYIDIVRKKKPGTATYLAAKLLQLREA